MHMPDDANVRRDAQLVQLRQTEVIRAFNDNGVAVGMSIPVSIMVVQTSTLKLDDGNHSSPVPVRARASARDDGDPRFWHQFCQPFGGFLNVSTSL